MGVALAYIMLAGYVTLAFLLYEGTIGLLKFVVYGLLSVCIVDLIQVSMLKGKQKKHRQYTHWEVQKSQQNHKH